MGSMLSQLSIFKEVGARYGGSASGAQLREGATLEGLERARGGRLFGGLIKRYFLNAPGSERRSRAVFGTTALESTMCVLISFRPNVFIPAAVAMLISKKTTTKPFNFKNHDNRYPGQVRYFKKTDRRPSPSAWSVPSPSALSPPARRRLRDAGLCAAHRCVERAPPTVTRTFSAS